jgi:3-isopropylmalate dehydrogenase
MNSTPTFVASHGPCVTLVRELIGGIYFGKPKGFGVDDAGNKTGFNTMIYSVPEIERIARVGFETAKKRSNRLCSVEKSNVLEVSQARSPYTGPHTTAFAW